MSFAAVIFPGLRGPPADDAAVELVLASFAQLTKSSPSVGELSVSLSLVWSSCVNHSHPAK